MFSLKKLKVSNRAPAGAANLAQLSVRRHRRRAVTRKGIILISSPGPWLLANR